MAISADLEHALAALPEHNIGEIIEGVLITSPLLPPRAGRAKSVILARIFMAVGGEWWILPAVEIEFHGDVLVPDLSGWRRRRVPELPESRMELSPDWICEIVTPSTALLDRSKKLPIYAREHALFAWLVDPLEKTVDVFKLVGDAWQLDHVYGGDEQISAPPFEELAIDLRTVWG